MAPEDDRTDEQPRPDWGVGAVLDPASFADALRDVAAALARRPQPLAAALSRFAEGTAAAGAATLARVLGGNAAGPARAAPDDRRFRDAAWEQNPIFFGVMQGYLMWSSLMRDLVDAAALEPPRDVKARFAVGTLVDAAAPTNTLAGNPAALKRALDTGGSSVVRGLRNLLTDLAENRGMPRQVDVAAFDVGRNLAVTPGKVVFRNRLFELLQYEPRTSTVFETPLLFSPPWINKYYVLDLAPGRSLIEFAVARGHTVFAISYVNPGTDHRDVGFADYLREGPLAALDVIGDITGSRQANVLGLCLGGTLAAMAAARTAAGGGEQRVRSLTLLNALLDFAEPGPLAAFVDERTIERLERRMAEKGYLDASQMAGTFSFLRGNDLIWSYVGSSWLMGEPPPAFDILAWNADSTRMPARMHSEYLRRCYVENRLAAGELEVDGVPLALEDVASDAYVVASEEDHIAPWRSAYRSNGLLGGRVRFVLTSSGHIAGVVNPPGGKRSYRAADDPPADSGAFVDATDVTPGSWWEDWAKWLATRSGRKRKPPPLGGDAHPPLGDAPGTYVHAR